MSFTAEALRRYVLGLAILWPALFPVVANNSPVQTEYRQRVWTRQHGLPSNYIRAILQTGDGFLWVATGQGLARFDGLKFIVFDHNNTAAFRGDECTALAEDTAGDLWIGTAKGLVRLHGGEFTSFTAGDGLWDNYITVLCATSTGGVWIGTAKGTSRRHGGTFTRLPYHQGALNPNENAKVTLAIYEDATKAIWVGSEPGLQHWDNRTGWLRDTFFSSLGKSQYVKHIAQDSSGSLWLRGRYLWKVDDDTWNETAEREELSDDNITCLFSDRTGNVWLATKAQGLVQWRDQRMIPRGGKNVLPDNQVTCLCDDRENNLWIGTQAGGLVQWVPRRFVTCNTRQGLANDNVWALCCRRDGSVWIGTDGGISRLDRESTQNERSGSSPENSGFQGRFMHYAEKDGLCDNAIRAFFEGKSGTLWIGTGNGLDYFHDGKFRHHSFPVIQDTIRAIQEDRFGSLWVGSRAGLHRLDNGNWLTYTTASGLPTNDIRCLLEGQDGNLWIGTAGGGLCRLVIRDPSPPTQGGYKIPFLFPQGTSGERTEERFPRKHSRIEPPNRRPALFSLPSSVEGRAGERSRSSFRFMESLHFNFDTHWDHEPIIDARSAHEFFSLSLPKGEGWGEGSVLPISARRFMERVSERTGEREVHHQMIRFTTKDGLSDDIITVLYEDSEGILWIGTKKGLNRLQNQRLSAFTSRDGLFDDAIHQILEDDSGQFWIGSAKGIFKCRKQALHDLAAGRIRSVPCVGYNESDGLESSETNGGRNQPAAIKTADGRLWFATAKGVVIIDPKTESPTEHPLPIYIEQIRANGQTLAMNGKSNGRASNRETPSQSKFATQKSKILRLPPGGARVLEIRYTAPDLTAPESMTFRYRLEGYDEQWREAGNERAAYYTNLRPGDYQFHVTARNHHGIWNKAGASFAFSVAPYVWQTRWFQPVCWVSALSLFAGVLGHVNRYHKLRRAQVLAAERERIARDMHDELGSQLSQLGFTAASPQGANPGPDIPTTAELAQLAMRTLDDIVWATQPEKDRLDCFATYLSQRAYEYLTVAGVSLRIVYPDQIPPWPLSAQARQNVLLAAKEALTNIVKHAHATEVTIRLEVDHKRFTLQISDNGKGFRGDGVQMQPSANPGPEREKGESVAVPTPWISPSPPSDGGEGWGEEDRLSWFSLSSVLPVNRKEDRLLTPALPMNRKQKLPPHPAPLLLRKEEREKKAHGRFGGSMREWFRGILSPRGTRGERKEIVKQPWGHSSAQPLFSPANRNGLTNMRARIEACGGQFAVESETGTGTTVQFRIPTRKL